MKRIFQPVSKQQFIAENFLFPVENGLPRHIPQWFHIPHPRLRHTVSRSISHVQTIGRKAKKLRRIARAVSCPEEISERVLRKPGSERRHCSASSVSPVVKALHSTQRNTDKMTKPSAPRPAPQAPPQSSPTTAPLHPRATSSPKIGTAPATTWSISPPQSIRRGKSPLDAGLSPRQ